MANATLKFVGRAEFDDVRAELKRLADSVKKLETAGKKGKKGADEAKSGWAGFLNSIKGGIPIVKQFRGVLLDAFLVTAVVREFVQTIGRAVRAIIGLFSETQKVNIQLDASEIKLRAATDSASEYAEAMARADELVERLGLELIAVREGLADFIASTRSSNLSLAEQLSIFQSVTEASRVFNLSAERVKLAFLAIGQIASKGALAMEEVRRQLGDQIPGVIPLLAEKLGRTVPQLFEDIRNKAISAEEGLRALRDGLDDLVGEQIFEASRKLVADLGRLSTAVIKAKENFAEASEDGVQRFVQSLTDLIDTSGPAIERLGEIGGRGARVLSDFARDTNQELLALGEGFGVFALLVKERFGQFAELFRLVRVEGLSTSDAIDKIRESNDSLGKALEDSVITFRDTLLSVPPTADEVARSYSELAVQVEDGNVRLTESFKALGQGREEAAEQILQISEDVKNGVLSIAEAEEQVRAVVVTSEDDIRAQFIRTQRTVEESRAAIRRARERAAEGAKKEIDAEADLQDAFEETKRAAQSVADERIALEERMASEITAAERMLVDAVLANFEELSKGVELSGERRLEIEEELVSKLLDLEQKRQEKLLKAEDDFKQKAAGSAQARTQAAEKLSKDLVKIEVDFARRKRKLLDETLEAAVDAAEKETEAAEKETEKRIKAAEKEAKRRRELLAGVLDDAKKFNEEITELLEGDEVGGEVSVSGDGARGAAGELADARRQFAEVQQRLSEPIINETDIQLARELGKRIAELESQTRRTGGAFDDLGSSVGGALGGDDLVDFSEKVLESFQKLTVGSKDFLDLVRELPSEAQNALGSVFDELSRTAEAGNLNAENIREFSGEIESLVRQAEPAFELLGDKAVPQLGDSLRQLVDVGKEVRDEGLAPLGEGVSDVTEDVRDFKSAGEESRDAVKSFGEEADAAGENVDDLGTQTGEFKDSVEGLGGIVKEGSDAIFDLADAAANAATHEKQLADQTERVAQSVQIPEEAVESVRTFGEAASETAPKVQPLAAQTKILAEQTTTIATQFAAITTSITAIQGPLDALLVKIQEQGESGVLDSLVLTLGELKSKLEVIAPKLTESAESLGKLITEAEKAPQSAEKLGELQAALENIASEEVTRALDKVLAAMMGIRAEFDLSVTAVGKLETKFNDLQIKISETFEKMDAFIVFIDDDFIPALNRLLEKWQEVVTKTDEHKTQIGELEDSYSSLGEVADSVLSQIDKRLATTVGNTKTLIDDLRTALDLAKQL